MSAEQVVVMTADGTVLAVEGGAPAEWIGTRVEEREDVPADVRRMAAETHRRMRDAGDRGGMASTSSASTGTTMRIVALHAMPLRRTAIDLRALLASSIAVMEQQARAMEVALTLEVAPEVPKALYADPEKVAWTMTALVGNALRFVRAGTRTMPGGSIRVRARYEPTSSSVLLEVQDDGSGVPKEALSRLLTRLPGQAHAAGLGLSLIQDIVAAHGGAVQVSSSTEPDQSGTTVRLTLPCR